MFLSPRHSNECDRHHIFIVCHAQVCGFPLHAAFSDVESIVEAVTSTGVHLNREPGVEFALAVHVEPFANNVMSVWVYVASMVRRR